MGRAPATRLMSGCVAVAASPPPDVEPVEHGVWCVLDGYIDNAGELAAQLGLSAATPVEAVLAEGFRRWREQVLSRLLGDFALFLWDRRAETGLLARDQLGTRSLFLYRSGRELRFASDLRNLLPMLSSTPAPDEIGVLQYLAPGLDRATPGRTLYRGVSELLPAHAVRFGPTYSETFRYWWPALEPVLRGTHEELAATVSEAVDRAVRRRLAPDGMTGVMMSGGLDSTAVAGVAANTDRPVRCYSAILPDHPDEDESFWIARMLEARSLTGVSVPVTGQGMLTAGLQALQAWRTPPRAATDFMRMPLALAAAADGAELLIGGDGGDETFAVRTGLIADRLGRGRILSALGLVRSLPAAGDHPPWPTVLRAAWYYGADAFRPCSLEERARRSDYETHRWLRPERARELLEQGHRHLWREHPGPRWWAQAVDLATAHASFGMFGELRHTANLAGVDMRFPLLDLDLVKLMLRLPPECSFDPHMNRPLFRSAMKGTVPDEVRLRPAKTVFNGIHCDSMLGPDWPTVERLLTARDAQVGAYVDLLKTRALVEEARRAAARGSRASIDLIDDLWRLTLAECWLRDQADPEFSAALASPLLFRANPPFFRLASGRNCA